VLNPFGHGFLGSARVASLGQITDPKILARVELAEAFGNAIKAVSKVVQVPPEIMAASPGSARETFKALIKNPQFVGYVIKLLVLASIMVKEDIRALGFDPAQLSNVLQGADQAVRGVVAEDQLPQQLKNYENEIINAAPEHVKAEVRRMVESTGITIQNLSPNLPPEASGQGSSGPTREEGLSGLQKAALIGVPVLILAAVGIAWKS
jgi:hypothetical protein